MRAQGAKFIEWDNSKPLVTCLMCVYNGGELLSEAISSILSQTFQAFEFVIIDDASTDDSVARIRAFADQRIRLFENPENMGLTKSLNKGLLLASGKYIARIDADDFSLPSRLERQLQVMESGKASLVGTFALVKQGNQTEEWTLPVSHVEILSSILKMNPFVHSSVMFRRRPENVYDEQYRLAQDYDLWLRISSREPCLNIDEFLTVLNRREEDRQLKYEVISKQIVQHHLQNLGLTGKLVNSLLFRRGLGRIAVKLYVAAYLNG